MRNASSLTELVAIHNLGLYYVWAPLTEEGLITLQDGEHESVEVFADLTEMEGPTYDELEACRVPPTRIGLEQFDAVLAKVDPNAEKIHCIVLSCRSLVYLAARSKKGVEFQDKFQAVDLALALALQEQEKNPRAFPGDLLDGDPASC